MFFTQHELSHLDDLMPENVKRKKEDTKKKKEKKTKEAEQVSSSF